MEFFFDEDPPSYGRADGAGGRYALASRNRTETLTGKTLTAPTITSPTITGATIATTAGAGTQSVRSGGLLFVDVTAAATAADTDLTIFASYAMPANTVNATKDVLRITAWGKFGATANTKNVFLTIGGDGIRSMTSDGNNVGWYLQTYVVRLTSGNYDTSQGMGFVDGAAVDVGTPANANENFATELTISCKGQNGTAAAADITYEGMIVEFLPAPVS